MSKDAVLRGRKYATIIHEGIEITVIRTWEKGIGKYYNVWSHATAEFGDVLEDKHYPKHVTCKTKDEVLNTVKDILSEIKPNHSLGRVMKYTEYMLRVREESEPEDLYPVDFKVKYKVKEEK